MLRGSAPTAPRGFAWEEIADHGEHIRRRQQAAQRHGICKAPKRKDAAAR
jgi:hypothetical protein